MRDPAPVCPKCHLSMESIRGVKNRVACPMCGAEREIIRVHEIPKIPKCSICNRKCVAQGDLFVCPNCRNVFDAIDEHLTTAMNDPTKRIQMEEAQQAKSLRRLLNGGR